MSYPSVYAWPDELSAVEFQAALDAAKQDAERVRTEFVDSLAARLSGLRRRVDHPIRQRGPIDFRVLGGTRSRRGLRHV